MSWLSELLQLQRVRRSFLRFAKDLNTEGPWIGAVDRRYGRLDDGRGTIPILGTVDSFGSFKNQLSNHEFTLEIPSISTDLFDPTNEWRTLSDRPSNNILDRRIGYYIRQEDDAGAILDQQIAVGQITGEPRFPNGKVGLSLEVPGGDLLGDNIPRRLLTTKDWPRALPDDAGKVIPLPYGRLNNLQPSVTISTAPVEGCNTCLKDVFGGSPTYIQGPENFDSYGGVDANLTAAGWIFGGSVLTNSRAYSGAWSAKTVGGGIAKFIAPSTASPVLIFGCRYFYVPGVEPFLGTGLLTLSYGAPYTGFNGLLRFHVTTAGAFFLDRSSAGGGTIATSPPVLVPNAWNCINLIVKLDDSGAYRAYANSTLAMAGTADLKPFVGIGPEYINVGLHNSGGMLDDEWVAEVADYDAATFCDFDPTPIENVITVECGDTDGINDQGSAGRGGWLRLLLGDTGGGTVGISDYPTVAGVTAAVQPSPHAAPTLSATAVTGGFGVPSLNYYAIATVHSGVLSELSNVVAVTNTSTNNATQLSWSGLASGADHVRVYRGDATFNQMDRYRVSGNPYSEHDVPVSETGLLDLYPDIDTRDQLDPDPHWDLNYPKYAAYEVSVIYDDGVQSTCLSSNQVLDITPRNPPRDILVSWTPPTPPAGRTIVAYTVRRQTQSYNFGWGYDREWVFDAGTTSFTDPFTDTTAVSACATEATGGQKPTYIVSGWTCKAIDEVFVLKPDPLSENKEMVQVLMVAGTDYTDEIREINGNRYHVLVFEEQQRSDTCQYYEVTANIQGADYNADGSGDLITNADDIWDHFMLNVVLNTYRSSVGTYAPSGGQWFTDTSYAPGLFDRPSVQVAKAVGVSRLGDAGGYQGAGALTIVKPARQHVYEFLFSYDLELYQFNGVWYTHRLDAPNLVRGSLTAVNDTNGVAEGSFTPTLSRSQQVNLIPYFAGPIGGEGDNGYVVSGEVADQKSINDFRRVITSDPMYLLWTRHAQTAFSVVSRYLERLKEPLIGAEFEAPIWLYTLPPSTAIRFTHPDGLGPAGFLNRVMRVLSVDVNLDTLTCQVVLRDIDYLVP